MSGGGKEYITPEGHAKLVEELRRLWEIERPEVVKVVHWAAGNGDRSENGDYIYGKKRLRQIDSRVRFLRKRLESVIVFDPALCGARDRVFFGAVVTFERENGRRQTVTLVGRDEIDTAKGWISLHSPIGRALLGKGVGDIVPVSMPGGDDEIEIINISY